MCPSTETTLIPQPLHPSSAQLTNTQIPDEKLDRSMNMKQGLDVAIAKGGKFRSERKRFVQEYEWIARSMVEADNKLKEQAQTSAPVRYDRYKPQETSPQKAPAKTPGPATSRYDRYEPPKQNTQRKRPSEWKPAPRNGKKHRKN